MSKIRIVHYINQFFAQIGGEEKSDYPIELREGEAVGPGLAFKAAFGDQAEIVGTIVCGDSYFNENIDATTKTIVEMVKKLSPDVVMFGPSTQGVTVLPAAPLQLRW